MKQWYRLSDGVEYSTDFDFFWENQLMFTLQGSRATFASRLETKTFLIKLDTFGLHLYLPKNSPLENSQTDWDFVKSEARKIHQDILSGKFGIGELID